MTKIQLGFSKTLYSKRAYTEQIVRQRKLKGPDYGLRHRPINYGGELIWEGSDNEYKILDNSFSSNQNILPSFNENRPAYLFFAPNIIIHDKPNVPNDFHQAIFHRKCNKNETMYVSFYLKNPSDLLASGQYIKLYSCERDYIKRSGCWRMHKSMNETDSVEMTNISPNAFGWSKSCYAIKDLKANSILIAQLCDIDGLPNKPPEEIILDDKFFYENSGWMFLDLNNTYKESY